MCCDSVGAARPTPRRAARNEASTVAIGRAFMPAAERSESLFLRGRGPLPVCLHTIRAACESASVTRPCLSPPASGRGTERSEAAGQRSCSLAAAQRSEVQRTETDGVRVLRTGNLPATVCACWRMCQAEAQPRRNEKRSRSAGIVRQAAQSVAASFGSRGSRSAAWASDARAAKHDCQRSESASDAVLAQRCLACLRAGLCRNGMERPRRCLPSSPAPERVAEWSGGMDQRRSQAVPAGQVPRDGTACRVLAGPSNTLCRLRRLVGLTALRKTVPAVGEALRAGGRHDVGGEREARVVETSRSCGEFGASRPSRAPKNVRWQDDVRVPATSEGTETSNGRAWAARGAPSGTSLPRQKAPR